MNGATLARNFSASRPLTCSVVPNATTCSTPGSLPRIFSASAGRFSPVTSHVVSPAAFTTSCDRAAGEQVAVGDVGEPVAALRLVHVMRRDEHRQAVGGELVNFLPKIAARLRVHARRRLVEQEQLRLVNQAGGQREPLFPAAGKLPGKLPAPVSHAEAFETFFHGGFALRHFVKPRDEIQIFLDGQILVKAEPLRHVADALFDLGDFAAEIEAEASVRRRRRA